MYYRLLISICKRIYRAKSIDTDRSPNCNPGTVNNRMILLTYYMSPAYRTLCEYTLTLVGDCLRFAVFFTQSAILILATGCWHITSESLFGWIVL